MMIGPSVGYKRCFKRVDSMDVLSGFMVLLGGVESRAGERKCRRSNLLAILD